MRSASRSIHVAALASIAIAQPIFDLLGRAPEFLLAHDLGPSEIRAVVATLGAGLPLACALAIALLTRVHEPSARVASSVMMSLFVALVALYAIKSMPAAPWFLAAAGASAGAAAGVLYHRFTTVRSFTAWLAPGIVVVPLLFMVRPGVRSLMWPAELEALQATRSTTPIVFVVFDGLPLTALLDANLAIDRDRYPSFAALADHATWYRNATTVSDYTQWALPSILSGRYPVARSLPIASDHPETLFTLLGSSHSLNVQEPITRLCPQSLCDHGGEGMAHELVDFAGTLSVAYLHAIAPEGLRGALPPVNQGWAEGVPPSDNAGEVWMRAGDRSRRSEAVAFINTIEAGGPQPSLHFLHVLLPHIPLVYLPGGQRYGTERILPGLLDTRDRWIDDEWAATQGYRRFLLQVEYVDTLLGQLVARLKEIDIYDRALIVVASDHGGSFKPGLAFRRLTDDTYADIIPVPLLMKAPHQREGVISDRNVETIDILPTIADIANIEVPWKLHGTSALESSPSRPQKTVFHDNAKRVQKFRPALHDAMRASVDRKIRLFGAQGNLYLIPQSSPHRELIGRALDDLSVSDAADGVEFALDPPGDFSNVDTDSRFLPAQLAGRARWLDNNSPAVIAIAVNGIVRATTRTYRTEERGLAHRWSLVLPPDSFNPGENEVEVFVLRPSGQPVLRRAYVSRARPVDVLSNAAAYGMGVSYEGLHDRRGRGERSMRWTDGEARIVVPRNGSAAPRSLRVTLATAGPAEKGLIISANGCEIFEGRVPPARWSRILALTPCGNGDETTVIELRSPAHQEAGTGRELGVAVERIDLLKEAWPPSASPLPDEGRRSQIRFGGNVRDRATVESTRRLTVTVLNKGTSTWAGPGDLGQENGAVRLGVMWFPGRRTDQPAAIQRVELPQAMVPGDSVEFAFELVPVAPDGPLPPGEYEAWIGLLQEGVSWFYSSGDSVRKLRVIHNPRP